MISRRDDDSFSGAQVGQSSSGADISLGRVRVERPKGREAKVVEAKGVS